MEQYEENASGDSVKMPESFELVLNLKVMSASICPLLENVADVYSGNLKLPLQICRPLLQPNPQLLLTSKILGVGLPPRGHVHTLPPVPQRVTLTLTITDDVSSAAP